MFSLDIYSEDESQPQQHQHERLSNTYLYENGSDCIEDGWFFYLSEVALRRIVNRALLSRHHLAATYSAQGLNIMQEVRDEELQKTVNEFDLQIQEWYVVNSFIHLLHLLISLPIPVPLPEEDSLCSLPLKSNKIEDRGLTITLLLNKVPISATTNVLFAVAVTRAHGEYSTVRPSRPYDRYYRDDSVSRDTYSVLR